MDLSVIVLSYNTSELTKRCLDALVNTLTATSLKAEIIVVDNASTDDSPIMLKKFEQEIECNSIQIEILLNDKNTGYTGGNNQGIKVAKGKYILLLNSDAIVEKVDFSKLLTYMNENSDIGILTVKVNLPDGGIDPASHRGFPTPWNAFCYFSKLENFFGTVPVIGKIFGGYHLLYKDLNSVHEIDSPTGAFFLTRKKILDEIDGFDEDYFMYGEDLDLSYRIKQKGYKVIYYPEFTVLHIKSHSGMKGKDEEVRRRTRKNFYESMKIFYRKHYNNKYPFFIQKIVFFFIDYKAKRI